MRTSCLFLCLLASGAIYADAMATSVCVIEKSKFEALLKDSGTAEKIPTAKLWQAGFCGYLDKDLNLRIERDGAKYQLIAARRDSGTLYSLSVLTPEKPATADGLPAAQLVSVGLIPRDKEVKEDWNADDFVVVLRSGNFALQ